MQFYPDVLPIFNKLSFNTVLDAKKLCAPETNIERCLSAKSHSSMQMFSTLTKILASSNQQSNAAIDILANVAQRAVSFLSLYCIN
jgi:hypothetical protein